MLACSFTNKKFLEEFIDNGRINKQDILENMDLLQDVLKYTGYNEEEVKEFIMHVLQ